MQTPNQPWSAKEIETLRALYPKTNNEDIAILVNRSTQAVAHKAHRLKLRKSDKFLNSKLSGRYRKDVSWFQRLLNWLRSC